MTEEEAEDKWIEIKKKPKTRATSTKREYDKVWEDVHKAQSLGLLVRAGFLKALREASGRKK